MESIVPLAMFLNRPDPQGFVKKILGLQTNSSKSREIQRSWEYTFFCDGDDNKHLEDTVLVILWGKFPAKMTSHGDWGLKDWMTFETELQRRAITTMLIYVDEDWMWDNLSDGWGGLADHLKASDQIWQSFWKQRQKTLSDQMSNQLFLLHVLTF